MGRRGLGRANEFGVGLPYGRAVMRCVERVKVGVEGDVLTCDPYFVICCVDAVS